MSAGFDEAPPRPSLPPLAAAALGAWVTVMLVEELSWRAFIDEAMLTAPQLRLVIILVMLLSALALRAIAKRGLATLPFLIACAVTILCAGMHWITWAHDAHALSEVLDARGELVLDITSDPAQRDYGTISNAELRNGAQVTKLRVLWPDGSDPVSSGHRIAAQGTLSSIKSDEAGHWNHQNGFVGMLRIASFEAIGPSPTLQGLAASFRDASFERIKRLEGDAAGLLGGILLGNKTLFTGTELELAFQTTGLAHLMAVSGTHLAIVTMLLALVIGKTRLRRSHRNALVFVALLAYVAITGFAPSAMRACTMCAVALLLGTLKRRAFVFNALALCVFVFLSLSPSMAFSMGFQLSVLSVLGLVVFSRLAQHWLAHAIPQAPEWLSASVAATLAASCITLPITVTQFAQLPLISPLANLIAAPLITIALCVGVIAILACALIEPLGMLALQLAGIIASFCATIVRLLADIPGACLPISNDSPLLAFAFAAMLVLLWIVWPVPKLTRASSVKAQRSPSVARSAVRASRVIGVCLFPVVLVIASGFGQQLVMHPAGDSRLVMLDVGQGDALLIQSRDAAVLVDTGENSDILIRELAEQGISHLDAIFVTHKDADHCGALQKLAGIVTIDHVYIHEDLLEEDFEEKVLEAARWVTNGNGTEGVRASSRFSIGDFALTIVAPEHGGTSANDDSLIMLLEHDSNHDGTPEVRGILTGDAEHQALARACDALGDIDFIKVAHHGSKGGATDEQLRSLKPEIALISVGADNKYGHPNQETIAQYEKIGARIYRTDRQGAVTMSFDGQDYFIFTERRLSLDAAAAL